MIVVIDDFLSKEVCNLLIKAHKDSPVKAPHESMMVVNFKGFMPDSVSLANYVSGKYDSAVQAYYGSSVTINYSDVVYWATGGFQGTHLDFPEHVVTSILYLNDNFEGGRTYLECGTNIAPKTGRIVFFKGNICRHGVEKITLGERWTSPTWYKEKNKI